MSLETSRIARCARRQDGVVMLAVIGVIAVATIVAIAAFAIAQQSLTESERIERESAAFQAADAGMEAALANISMNGFATEDYPLQKVLENGSYSVMVEALGNSEYKATSIGSAPDGSTETVVNRFFYLNVWEMNVSAGSQQSLAAGSGGMMGTSFFWGPLYVRGTLPMGNVGIYEGPLFVKEGDIVKAEGSPQIGTADEPVDIYVTGIIGNGVEVHASTISQSVPEITLPTIPGDLVVEMWTKSRDESVDNIMGSPLKSSTPNVEHDGSGDPTTYTTVIARSKAPNASACYKCIASDAGPSGAGLGTTTLVIGGTGSWGAWEGNGYDLGSGLHDDFAFDDTTDTLYLEGTVFVDGPIIFNGDVSYVGNGTIFANGSVTMNDTLRAQTATSHVDEGHALGIVTPTDLVFGGSGGNPCPPADPPDFSGAFFCQGIAYFGTLPTALNTYLKGSIIAGGMDFAHPNSHLETDPNLPSFLPDSLPGNGAFFLARGNWTRQ